MRRFIKIKVLLLLILLGGEVYSQIGVVNYNFDVMAVNLTLSKTSNYEIAGEIKTFVNREIEDISTELDVFYRFKERAYHRISIGLGFKTELFTDGGTGNTFLTPVTVEIYPIQDFKRFSFLYELAPEILFEDQIKLRNLIGLKYSFGK